MDAVKNALDEQSSHGIESRNFWLRMEVVDAGVA